MGIHRRTGACNLAHSKNASRAPYIGNNSAPARSYAPAGTYSDEHLRRALSTPAEHHGPPGEPLTLGPREFLRTVIVRMVLDHGPITQARLAAKLGVTARSVGVYTAELRLRCLLRTQVVRDGRGGVRALDYYPDLVELGIAPGPRRTRVDNHVDSMGLTETQTEVSSDPPPEGSSVTSIQPQDLQPPSTTAEAEPGPDPLEQLEARFTEDLAARLDALDTETPAAAPEEPTHAPPAAAPPSRRPPPAGAPLRLVHVPVLPAALEAELVAQYGAEATRQLLAVFRGAPRKWGRPGLAELACRILLEERHTSTPYLLVHSVHGTADQRLDRAAEQAEQARARALDAQPFAQPPGAASPPPTPPPPRLVPRAPPAPPPRPRAAQTEAGLSILQKILEDTIGSPP